MRPHSKIILSIVGANRPMDDMQARDNSPRKYRVVLADPPWGVEKFGSKISDHYPLMSIEDICRMPVSRLVEDDCLLLLWTTWSYVPEALSVIAAWGFEYQTGFPWVKLKEHPAVNLFGEFIARPTWGLGAWVRGCSEPVFIARRGDVRPEKHWLGLLSKRMEHSRKPDDIYEYAESFPGPYLELFARRRRDGWDAFGNEIDGSIQLDVD